MRSVVLVAVNAVCLVLAVGACDGSNKPVVKSKDAGAAQPTVPAKLDARTTADVATAAASDVGTTTEPAAPEETGEDPAMVPIAVDQPDKAAAKGPTVRLNSPVGGWSSKRIVQVSGTISDTELTRATLVVNGAPKGLSVGAGQFSTAIVLSPGANTVQVVATDAKGGVGRDAVTVFGQVPAKDVKILLTWDTDGTDIDLHVVEPTGNETYFGNRNSPIGATLDQDVTTGYGPETYTLANAVEGSYQVRAKYYSDNGMPQTFVRVDVILFEGTAREERLVFHGVLEKTDEVVHVASFTLPR